MDGIDYSGIQQVLDELLGTGTDFQAMAEAGVKGEGLFSADRALAWFQDAFLQELLAQRQLWIHILLLALAAAALIHFSDIFKSTGVPQISFCMIYMLLFLLLIASFQGSMEIAREVLENMRAFMTVLAPAYLMAMTLCARFTSGGVYYEFILLLISAVRRFAESFILPCIEVYVLLTLVNHLSREARLTRLAEFVGMMIGWSLKGALAVVVGFHMIQGLVAPAADAFRETALGRGLEMIPGVGQIGGSVTELVIGSAMLIKNGIGAAALVVLLLLCLVPLTKLAVIMAAYYLLAALLQPVSDERITDCLIGIGNGVRYLLHTVFTVLTLFLLTVALTAAATGR